MKRKDKQSESFAYFLFSLIFPNTQSTSIVSCLVVPGAPATKNVPFLLKTRKLYLENREERVIFS